MNSPVPDAPVSSTDPAKVPSTAPVGPTPDCMIVDSSGWAAWVNAMPGPNRPKLIVIGKVRVPSSGFQVSLVPGPVQESHPPVQQVIVSVTPPRQGHTGALVEHDVRAEMPALEGYGAVTIRCGNRTLATFTDIIRAQ